MLSNGNNSSLFKTSSCTHHLRIADVLLLDDEAADGGDLPLLSMDGGFGSDRRKCEGGGVVSRWLRCFGRAKEEEEEDEDVADVNVTNGGDLLSPVTQNHQSGCRCHIETSFNMGVGCSLLYLIAASKNELDKMMELKMQMEMLLKKFKEELQVRNASAKGMGSNCHHSLQNLATSFVQPESSTTIMTCDQSLKCDTPKDLEFLEGIDQLQVEFEAELERLQLQLDKEKLLQHPEQQSIEVTVGDTASSGSYSISSGEVIDPVIEPQETFTEVDYAVPPDELERRLHEVLEARQQEHIRELEAALECAKHKLREKEMEISWWRDTARLISQHVPGPSRRISERV